MNFKNQYLTFGEYKLMGGELNDEAPFDLYEAEAHLCLDRETQNRLKKNESIPYEVKVCLFKLIEGFAFDGNYRDANTDEKNKYIERIIFNCLAGVIVDNQNLLYRGI